MGNESRTWKVVPHGNGAKINAQKKDIGKRAYVIILKD